MLIRGIRLRDWKAYKNAYFEFPAPANGRNIILIGAPNGFGKTSLFEALTLGLFGREGLPLVPRATVSLDSAADSKLSMSYSKFLAEALHKRALQQGRSSCSVELEFEDDDGEPISIRRTWHFSSSGAHKIAEDDLVIYYGVGREPIGPPATVSDRGGWYRDFIAQNFLPTYLAQFFLFDGEQVQRFARRDMTGQVRRGIEGLLGLPVLISLRESLLRYATGRRSQVTAPSDQKVAQARSEISSYEAVIADAKDKIAEVDATLPQLLEKRDELSDFFSAYGGGSVAMVSELLQDENTHRDNVEKALEALMTALAGDVSIALSGAKLREATVSRLRAEASREAWLAGKQQGDSRLERFMENFSERLQSVRPALQPQQLAEIRSSIDAAWDALWHPVPTDCASDFLHDSLNSVERDRAIQRLEAASGRSASGLRNLVRYMRESADKAEEKRKQRLSIELSAPEADQKKKELQEVSEAIGGLNAKRAEAQRVLTNAEAELAKKRQELGRYTDAVGRGQLPLRRANQAEAIAAMIEKLLTDAVPSQVNQVARAMTAAWKSMARKEGLVDHVSISPDCEVSLINDRGENVREMQLSAGEEQIFTQALISAIADVSARDFPFVVDTPLGRLDEKHRIGILKHFTARSGQVILLSTDTEVVGPYLHAIRDRVSCAYKLNVDIIDGATITTVESGYFERI